MRTLEQWEYLARCSILNVTPENAKAIAVLCFEAEANGGKAAVWHMSSIVHNNSRCVCVDCVHAASFLA